MVVGGRGIEFKSALQDPKPSPSASIVVKTNICSVRVEVF